MKARNLLSRCGSRKSGLLMHRSIQPEATPGAVPDFLEPLVGWRAWKVCAPLSSTGSYPTLSSVILDTPWTPRREVSAEHNFDLGEKCIGLVGENCSCGVYAFRGSADALAYLVKVRDMLLGMSMEVAIGQVSLWGKVVECERGFKAQFAYPRHIYLPASFSRFMPTVQSAFGVEVGVYASICQEEINVTVPSDRMDRGGQVLNLRQSELASLDNFGFQVGFYDHESSSGGWFCDR